MSHNIIVKISTAVHTEVVSATIFLGNMYKFCVNIIVHCKNTRQNKLDNHAVGTIPIVIFCTHT